MFLYIFGNLEFRFDIFIFKVGKIKNDVISIIR